MKIRTGPCLFLLACILISPVSRTADADTPRGLLDDWVAFWGSYDLDSVDTLFLQDSRLTYFSSEREGLLRGYDAIVEHHRGFGFVPGGDARERRIWVDDVEIADFDSTALIAATWHFGDPKTPGEAQHGPMTMLAVRTPDGYRIGHMHFASYE